MLIIFTGNGKGKTSAALGTALRALGWGKKVAIIQFIKGNKEVGEWKILQKIPNDQCPMTNQYPISNIQIFQFFEDNKMSITDKSILANPNYKKSCEKAWNFAKKTILSKTYDLIILDEINNALHYGLLDKKSVLEVVGANGCSPEIDIILTGRNAPTELIEIADTVTEMKEIKHPFQKGINAKEGIDY